MTDPEQGEPQRRIAVTGASGLLGSALVPVLTAAKWRVRAVSRHPGQSASVRWDPVAGTIDPAALAGIGAAVHLAGEGIAEGRWTAAKKARIRSSRLLGTGLLARSLARLPAPPDVLVSASAIGIYGDRGDELLDETSSLGTDFLAEVSREWEAATAPAAAAGIRVVHLRLGIILARRGGALPRMARPFLLGAGGPIGGGRQWMSWISIDDAVRVILEALSNTGLRGPVNAVAPEPVRNADFATGLGAVLHRPAVIPVPAFALRLLFGELADVALLASQRVVPARLESLGFRFRHPTLTEALHAVLDR